MQYWKRIGSVFVRFPVKKAEITMLTTHVDLHGDRFAPEALEGYAARVNASYLPLMVEHDLRIPPIGRIAAATVVELEDGERAVRVTVEIFEGTDTEEMLSGDGREIPISRPGYEALGIEYDRSYQTKEGEEFLAGLRALSPDVKTVPIVKKALEPISTLTIAAGAFALGGIAAGFSGKIGEDLYLRLKAALVKRFKRADKPRLLDFRFTVMRGEQTIEIHLLLENPSGEEIEALLSSGFGEIDVFLNRINFAEYPIAKLFLRYDSRGLTLRYAVRRNCVPLLPLDEPPENKDND